MLNSVLRNTDSPLRIGIVVHGVPERDREWLVRRFPSAAIRFHEIDPQRLRGLSHKVALSPLAYARLFMADLVEWEKFVYLDVDTIARSDLAELEREDVDGHLCLACFPDGALNSGVLVVNARRWRDEGILEKALDYARRNQPREADQATIAAVCGDECGRLDPHWNRIIDPIWGPGTLDPAYYRDARILHFITGFKPWNLGRLVLTSELLAEWDRYRVRTRASVDWRQEAKLVAYQLRALLRVKLLGRR